MEPLSIALAGTLATSVLPVLLERWIGVERTWRRGRRDGIIDLHAARREGRTRGAVCAPAGAWVPARVFVLKPKPAPEWRTPPFRAPSRAPLRHAPAYTTSENQRFGARVEALLADALGRDAERRAFSRTDARILPRPEMPWMDARGYE